MQTKHTICTQVELILDLFYKIGNWSNTALLISKVIPHDMINDLIILQNTQEAKKMFCVHGVYDFSTVFKKRNASEVYLLTLGILNACYQQKEVLRKILNRMSKNLYSYNDRFKTESGLIKEIDELLKDKNINSTQRKLLDSIKRCAQSIQESQVIKFRSMLASHTANHSHNDSPKTSWFVDSEALYKAQFRLFTVDYKNEKFVEEVGNANAILQNWDQSVIDTLKIYIDYLFDSVLDFIKENSENFDKNRYKYIIKTLISFNLQKLILSEEGRINKDLLLLANNFKGGNVLIIDHVLFELELRGIYKEDLNKLREFAIGLTSYEIAQSFGINPYTFFNKEKNISLHNIINILMDKVINGDKVYKIFFLQCLAYFLKNYTSVKLVLHNFFTRTCYKNNEYKESKCKALLKIIANVTPEKIAKSLKVDYHALQNSYKEECPISIICDISMDKMLNGDKEFKDFFINCTIFVLNN
jgi:hypothetical protein